MIMCLSVEDPDCVDWQALVLSGCFYWGNCNEMSDYSTVHVFLNVQLPDLITGQEEQAGRTQYRVNVQQKEPQAANQCKLPLHAN